MDGRAVQEAYFRGRQLKGSLQNITYIFVIFFDSCSKSITFLTATGALARQVIASEMCNFMDAGTHLQLPEGYRGQILRRTAEQRADGDDTPQWSADMAFSELVYWKHGLDPICTDSAQRRMAFLKISQQV